MPPNNMEPAVGAELWNRFCEELKTAGQLVSNAATPGDLLTRVEGYRYLTRLLRYALESHIEFADRDFPAFFSPSHETVKIGGDNPDNLYLRAEISGANRYRISGRRGSVHYLSFTSQRGGYERDGRMEPTGFLDASALMADADGNIDITVSVDPAPGNWLPIAPDSTSLIVRQTFRDRRRETPATLSIRRLDSDARPQPFDLDKLGAGLERTARFVHATSALFFDWAQGYGARPNTLVFADQQACQAVGGDPNILYYHGQWRLSADQVLVVHIPEVPSCETWNLQINNFWYESLDYRHHTICLNHYSAQADADGGVTLVVAAADPQHPNWLETAGHTLGTLLFRWVRSSRRVDPVCRVVPRAEWLCRRRDDGVALSAAV